MASLGKEDIKLFNANPKMVEIKPDCKGFLKWIKRIEGKDGFLTTYLKKIGL